MKLVNFSSRISRTGLSIVCYRDDVYILHLWNNDVGWCYVFSAKLGRNVPLHIGTIFVVLFLLAGNAGKSTLASSSREIRRCSQHMERNYRIASEWSYTNESKQIKYALKKLPNHWIVLIYVGKTNDTFSFDLAFGILIWKFSIFHMKNSEHAFENPSHYTKLVRKWNGLSWTELLRAFIGEMSTFEFFSSHRWLKYPATFAVGSSWINGDDAGPCAY